MYPHAVILSLSLIVLTKAEKNFFDSLDPCDSEITANFRKDNLPATSDLLRLLGEHWPWTVNYATYKTNLKIASAEFQSNKIVVKVAKGGTGGTEVQIKDVNWEDLLNGRVSGDLRFYIWRFEEQALVFGYYLCKASGSRAEGDAKAHFGAAVTYANRIGAYPSEANDFINEIKIDMRDTYKAKIPPQDLYSED